ncbi:MAG: VCBS repeat-containing protein, partial [Bacteroidota bacterium]
TTTSNQLYINQGANQAGIPIFKEEAVARGVADEGHSTQGVFFDYDKDGDLDLFVANYPPTGFKTPNYSYRFFLNERAPEKSDRLYQNDGQGNFTDVSAEAGVQNFGLTLSATVGDYNQDGWEDLYLSNDFASPDLFYLNRGNGTFEEVSIQAMPHTAFFGMGADAADINNDGRLDLLQVDMTPEDNRRNKANMASMDVSGFWEMVNLGLHHQYMQNVVQLNQGTNEAGIPLFSDISRLTGMSSTDWSWAPLVADFDNDGWKDVFISNGTRRDINNKDYFNKIEKATYQEKQQQDYLELTLNMPSEKVPNYAFRNQGSGLSFEDVGARWGLNEEGFSNGAVYVDLDQDGDLELVVNNIDQPVSLYKNTSREQGTGNYLQLDLQGPEKNPFGIGAEITVKTEAGEQFQHLSLTRGFQSSVGASLHFGLGQQDRITELRISWPDGREQQLTNLTVNQRLKLNWQDAKEAAAPAPAAPVFFTRMEEQRGLDFVHKENAYDDFAVEVLLPHSYSRNGPMLARGDVNGDGWEDIFVGGAIRQAGALYLQDGQGSFTLTGDQPWEDDAISEDMGAVFFDADQDQDLDLYIVSGGNELPVNSPFLQDRLYLNDGKGQFSKAEASLPLLTASGSRVRAGDFDGDGDQDLFVGGRIVGKSYPLPAQSYLLRNDGLKDGAPQFSDVTESLAPQLSSAGLVTDAAWVDLDQDKKLDLVVVGEWMPITYLRNTGDSFTDETEAWGLAGSTGWWYSILAEDMDKDGDIDLVGGNLGLNYKYQASPEETFDVYAYDYDKNGNLDIVLGYYHEGVQYPVRGRQCSSEEIPTIKYKYKDYNSFAEATLAEIYTSKDLEASLHYQAETFGSTYFENKQGQMISRLLPSEAQLSSINGMVAKDVNGDGHLDLITAGNMYGSEVETPRNDASYGAYLAGNGKGEFRALSFPESGLLLQGDIKDLLLMDTPQGGLLIATQNNGPLITYLVKTPENAVALGKPE